MYKTSLLVTDDCGVAICKEDDMVEVTMTSGAIIKGKVYDIDEDGINIYGHINLDFDDIDKIEVIEN